MVVLWQGPSAVEAAVAERREQTGETQEQQEVGRRGLLPVEFSRGSSAKGNGKSL